MCLANMMLSIQQGERIPTVQEFSVKIGLARGTIQNALKFLCLYRIQNVMRDWQPV